MELNSGHLLHTLKRLTPSKHFCVAYSGGLDSHVLLHALAALRSNNPELSLRVIHIHHGLSANADMWAFHCQDVCADLNLPCLIERVNAKPQKKQSPEETARTVRYETLGKLLEKDECLLTAHTQNDQAETVLLQLIRGAGIKGLAAMPEITRFYQAWLIRPLLHFTRAALVEYAAKQQLHWIEDESNLSPDFDRNYLRHHIFPLLQQRWPAVYPTFARSAGHCAQANELLSELANLDLLQVKGISANTLIISRLIYFSPARQSNILRTWLHQLDFPLPSQAKLLQLQKDLFNARPDAIPKIEWEGIEIRRFNDQLYALKPLTPHDPSLVIPWDLQQDLVLPNALGKLQVEEHKGKGIALPPQAKLTVQFRQGGEVCQPVGRREHHTLKHLFQEWKVLPWLRDRIPLIYVNDVLVAVVGYCICERFQVKGEEQGKVISLVGC